MLAKLTAYAINEFTHREESHSEGAFTPDANDANKSCYLREVGRLNILSLLAPFAREIRAIRSKFTTIQFNSRRLICANSAAGLSFASLH